MPAETSSMLGPDRGLGVLAKLSEAVSALATGPGRVQERLREAVTHLALITRSELPSDELRPILVEIVDALAAAQLLDPLGNLGDEEAVYFARRILELHRLLERSGWPLEGKGGRRDADDDSMSGN